MKRDQYQRDMRPGNSEKVIRNSDPCVVDCRPVQH